ncbi:MAG: hypothetical protein ABIO70_34215 [Pseudomonadota bacterium]
MCPLTRRRFNALLAGAGTFVAVGGRPAHAAGPTPVEADLGAVEGSFRRLSGVQGSPWPIVEGDGVHTARYREHHIDWARFPQDCAPNTLTLGGIFPDAAADPDDPASYRFGEIDQRLEAAREAGCAVLWQASYDLGPTDAWQGLNLGGRPPRDLERWCAVLARCLAHFSVGWTGGLHGAVQAVEFINEPTGLGGFGGRHLPELIPAFACFLDTVAAHNLAHPEAPVRAVGPGVPLCWSDWPAWEPRFTRLLAELRAGGRALPVFSFHTYGDDTSPASNARLARALRALLDAQGFEGTELWNTEWQGGGFLRDHLRIRGATANRATEADLRHYAAGLATYVLSCKLRWQGVVDGSFVYRANQRAFPPGRELPVATLRPGLFFAPDGTVWPLAQQELLTWRLQQAAPLRCGTAHDDDRLLLARVFRSEDSNTVAMLACNLHPVERSLVLRLRGLPQHRRIVGLTSSTLLGAGLVEEDLPLPGVDPHADPLALQVPALASRLTIARLG